VCIVVFCFVQVVSLYFLILPYIHAPILSIRLFQLVSISSICPGWFCKRIVNVIGLSMTIDKSVQASFFRINSLDFLIATFIEFLYCSLISTVARFFFINLSVEIINTLICSAYCPDRFCIYRS
jgi:hypothetical protein